MCFKRKSDGELIVDLDDLVPLKLKLKFGIDELLQKKRLSIEVKNQTISMFRDELGNNYTSDNE